LASAIKRTKTTAPKSSTSAPPTLPTITSRSGNGVRRASRSWNDSAHRGKTRNPGPQTTDSLDEERPATRGRLKL
jgi:hypothetical protein